MSDAAPELLRTPLHALHVELGARMVPFAGYSMPVQYPAGLMAEHRQCRERAALFDVSHMGQVALFGADVDRALERLVPVDVLGIGAGRQRYAFFTNEQGGILDDLMVSRPATDVRETFGDLFVVVNAACKAQDIDLMTNGLGAEGHVQPLPDRALLALQGPKAGDVLARLAPATAALTFMTSGVFDIGEVTCHVSRSGYTGEDGFEISVPAEQAEGFARQLLADADVAPAGLGARDTLRLEAGMCLYGHDIDTTTTPVEAALTWAIQKVRRPGGERAGGYPGAAVITDQLANGATRKRVGLRGRERAPVREGTPLFDSDGNACGQVTSGTLGPSVGQPIAMAYTTAATAAPGSTVMAEVRGKRLPMDVVPMPFQPHRYRRA